MTKIVIDSNPSKPVTGWSNSINDANATVTVDGNIVTIVFTTPVDTFEFSLVAQVRANAITVYSGTATVPEVPTAALLTMTIQ